MDPDDGCETGNGECCENGPQFKGDPINIYSGNTFEKETDIQFPTNFKEGFVFQRYYNSRGSSASSIGNAWRHSFSTKLNEFSYISNVVTYSVAPYYEVIRKTGIKISDDTGKAHYFYLDNSFVGLYSEKSKLYSKDQYVVWKNLAGVEYSFENGKLAFMTDEEGNKISFEYDGAGRLTRALDESTFRALGFNYNADGLIESITGPITEAVPDGLWVRYQYDTNGNLRRVEHAGSNNGSGPSGFEYIYADPNAPHNLTEKHNLAGEFLSSWQYDAQDRAWKNIARDGKGVTINYSTSSVLVTDAQGVQKSYTIATIDGRRRITNITGASGCASCGGGGDIVRYGYDEAGRINEIEHANGRIDLHTDFDA